MDDLNLPTDVDDLVMDLEEAEGSEFDEDDEEFVDEQIQASFLLPSPGPCSAATSNASSPINDEFSTTPIQFPTNPSLPGKQLGVKRGRGRPRREGGKPFPKRPGAGNRMRKLKSSLYQQRGFKRWKSMERSDFDLLQISSSPNDELASLDPETGTFVFTEREKQIPLAEDIPHAPEQWPGKVCAFCNLGERSQLGQSELLRLNCPEGFIPQRITQENTEASRSLNSSFEKESEEKSPRGPVTCRRQKSFNKCRHPSMTSEYIDELTIIGYSDQPDVSVLFESTGHFYVHRNCVTWSAGVVRNDNSTLDNVGPTVLQSSSKKCSFCNHYGASISCKVDACSKIYHYPCATASGAFQEIKSFILFCSSHLGQATVECQDSICYTCKSLGDISNLMYCSSCGEHYHGICVGLAQLPGVRAGWQCRKCRICQVCRMTGDETKLMTCEQCDKVYHASCQRPIVTSIPKYGWKCRCCRICGDCGSRTPGAGLSSRWHAHYTVCDSCYQQRNKGFSCPLCHRAYRAHAHREMVQCSLCHKFVHGTCDPEADLMTYNQRKDQFPDYEYVCSMCKNHSMMNRQMISKRSSIDEQDLSVSQESLYDENFEFDLPPEGSQRYMGLGKGKPYSASKIAKKRLGFGMVSNRPKGVGKILPGKVGFMKRQRLNEFCRKRGPKAKMRGLFGVPGVGLQRPTSDGKNDEEPGIENRLILCSAKDKFVLTQDICVMCGALGTDQEGCLIACVQCGQCYHPYCVNVKITKVILQNGWRCLDCTVCEGCGQRNDESRLILCDDCDISYHIYCMDPPLDYVPQGNWKCKWCAICQMCGNTDPGFNCQWMNSFSECGPCASQINCPACMEPYGEGELIIQCGQCERWLHGKCDSIKTEDDAEKCAADSYSCILCRPRDVPPPHLIPSNNPPVKPPTPTKSPELKAASNSNYFMDGVCLSETGHSLIKSMCLEYSASRKKRKKLPTVQDKEAGILATIESVVAGGLTDSGLDDTGKLDLGDKDDAAELYKEGMIWTKEDGPAPEGFTIFTMESGVSVLRRKRQRNLQKLGIGGFLVRVRGIRGSQENSEFEPVSQSSDLPGLCVNESDKPKRKPMRRKIKTKLSETFPSYLQEAFFGKDLMDSNKDLYYSKSEDEDSIPDTKEIKQEDFRNVPLISPKQEHIHINDSTNDMHSANKLNMHLNLDKVDDFPDNADDIGDVLNLVPGGLLDNDLVNTIMNEDKHSLPKKVEDIIGDADLDSVNSADLKPTIKDEMDILGANFNIDSIKDVEDMIKGVLTDESQESQESNANPIQTSTQQALSQHLLNTGIMRPSTLATQQNNLSSPLSFPPQSPYHSEYSNSPQFSPAFSEPPSPWVSVTENTELDTTTNVTSTYNQRSSEKMKADESLGSGATISAVLYANINHPEWKTEFPTWTERNKQIIKKWRTLSSDQKAPYLQKARDNRSAQRMKKQQQSQISKEGSSSPKVTKSAAVNAVTAVTPTDPSAVSAVNSGVITSGLMDPASIITSISTLSEEQEKVTTQNKSTKEAEQERQWKQLQALRQQQAQQQQHVIQEQRIQAIARVQRQISDTSQLIIQEPDALLHVKSADDTSLIMPSPTRTQTFQQVKYQDFTQAASDITQQKLSYIENKDMNAVITSNILDTSQSQSFQQKMPAEKYIFQSAPIKTQFQLSESALQRLNLPEQVSDGAGGEVNPQLRDLLQGQQFKKLDERLIGKGQQRVWPPVDSNVPENTTPISLADLTFRQPLPPNAMRPKLMIPANTNLRDPLIGFKQQLNANPRMRLLLQHQQVQKLQLLNDRRLPQMQQQSKEANIASILSDLPGVSEQDLQKHLPAPPYELKIDNQQLQHLNVQQVTLNQQQLQQQQQQQLVSQHQQHMSNQQHQLTNQQLNFLAQNKLNPNMIRKQLNQVSDKSEQVKNLNAQDVRDKIKLISRSLSQPHDAGDISSLIEEELSGAGGSR